jgi:hypothetical protein
MSWLNESWHVLLPDGRQRWLIQFQFTARHAREFLSEVAKMPEVYAIER